MFYAFQNRVSGLSQSGKITLADYRKKQNPVTSLVLAIRRGLFLYMSLSEIYEWLALQIYKIF